MKFIQAILAFLQPICFQISIAKAVPKQCLLYLQIHGLRLKQHFRSTLPIVIFTSKISNGHSHNICQNHKNLARQMSFFSKKTFVEVGKFGKTHDMGSCKFGWFLSQVILSTKIEIFMYKMIQSTLTKFAKFVQYLPNLPHASYKINSKKVFFGKYKYSQELIKLVSICIR